MPFNRSAASKDLSYDLLMILLETKSTVAKSAKFLNEVMDASIQYEAEQGSCTNKTFGEVKQEHNELWSPEKIISEFRKLFTDKTSFMSIYANTKVVESKVIQDADKECTFKPRISNKAKHMTVILKLFVKIV